MGLGDESIGHVAEDEVTDLTSFIRTSRSSFISFSLHRANLKRGSRVAANLYSHLSS